MSKLLEVITNPNPILRKKSIDIELGKIKSEEYRELINDMVLTMEKKDGVGLAAPQIGKNIRLIVIKHQDKLRVMINPEISKKSWAKEDGEEGCLSVPNTFGTVRRHKRINLIYIDQNAKKIKLVAKDMLARIIQHEIDHLDGVLFIDKAKNITS